MILARQIDRDWDLADMAEDFFRRHGKGPAELLALTPFELVALYGADQNETQPDRLSELRRLNLASQKPPAIPSWLMPKVPRKKAKS